MNRLILVAIGVAAGLSAQTPPEAQAQTLGLQHVSFVAKLLSPISTKTSNQGDMFTAIVEDPAQYQGAVLEGRITKLKKPKKGVGKGKAEIAFEFDTITFNSKSTPVTVDLEEVQNSKGVKAVDEEGRAIGKTSNKKRALATLAGGALGAGIGALAGGAQGAAKGGAIGLAAGLALGLTMTTAGSDLEFLPGSHLTLDVSDRGRGKR
jgi:hypothetical protein